MDTGNAAIQRAPGAALPVVNGCKAAALARGYGSGFDAIAALKAMQDQYKLARGDLAALLGVQQATIDSWLIGREPCGCSRHHIWLVSSLLDGTAPRTAFELATWGKYRRK